MGKAIRIIIRAIIRGLSFWFALGITGAMLWESIEIPAWWVALVTYMAKAYYDDLANGGGKHPAPEPE